MWQIIRNSIEVAAATLSGAMLTCILFEPHTYYRSLTRVDEIQLTSAIWGGIAGALAYCGWRFAARTLWPMRFSLRTLLIVLALGPPVLASFWFSGPGGLAVALLVAGVGVAAIVVLLAVSGLTRTLDTYRGK